MTHPLTIYSRSIADPLTAAERSSSHKEPSHSNKAKQWPGCIPCLVLNAWITLEWREGGVIRTRSDPFESVSMFSMGLTFRRVGHRHVAVLLLIRICQRQEVHHDCGMFELSKHPEDRADSVEVQVVRLEKYFLDISPTSTTIKEQDKAVILFILGTHEAAAGTETVILPRSLLFSFTCITGRPIRACRRTSASALTLTVNRLFTCISFAGNPKIPLWSLNLRHT